MGFTPQAPQPATTRPAIVTQPGTTPTAVYTPRAVTAAPGVNVPQVGYQGSTLFGIDHTQRSPVPAVLDPATMARAAATVSQPFEPREFTVYDRVTTMAQYRALHSYSLEHNDAFWAQMAEGLAWAKRWDIVNNSNLDPANLRIKWFVGGELNASTNCIDRHVGKTGPDGKDLVAIKWEGNDASVEPRIITYRELHEQVQKFANVLKARGVKKGDVVTLYMPMVPEAVVAMQACARIGAPHNVVFGGFSPEAIADRMIDSNSTVLITSTGTMRGAKTIELKKTADAAMEKCAEEGHPVKSCIVYKHVDIPTAWQEGRDLWWHEGMAAAGDTCPPEIVEATHPLFTLYTSGSTGKPKGVLHSTGGYLTYVNTTYQQMFDHQDGDVFFCTADVGWITGHSYIAYGPLAAGATVVMHDGIPNYPTFGRWWEICERQGVTALYTAPTAIRALEKAGDEHIEGHDLSHLKKLGTVGEPISPEHYRWFESKIGGGHAVTVDTYWQTETGGFMSGNPLSIKDVDRVPGATGLPFFGVQFSLMNNDGKPVAGNGRGNLVASRSHPGAMMGILNDAERFANTYYVSFPGNYFSGDGAILENGQWTITGRVDDVMNVSGHRLGTAELEAAMNAHEAVAECAFVAIPDDDKGEVPIGFVVLNNGYEPSSPDAKEELEQALRKHVAQKIGPFARPHAVIVVDAVPKTRSGKIMRRVLRKTASGQADQLGDVTTLENPAAVKGIITTWSEWKARHG